MSIRAFAKTTTNHPTCAASTPYTFLNFIIPATPDGKAYECTTPGVSGLTEPVWNSTVEQTTIDGDAIWTCRLLLSPNPIVLTLDTEGYGGYPLKEIWVKDPVEDPDTKDCIVYGSHDDVNWRQIDELTLPHSSGRDNRHKGFSNAYRYIKVEADSVEGTEIEIIAGQG